MPLSQVQIIRSLGEAISWFEKELAWGVEPSELRHLTGRIGELYAAMITRGQMALAINQRGYDVVSADNERISVKTCTSSNHVSFRKSTFGEVDRIIVLRINIDEGEVSIEELADQPSADFLSLCQDGGSEYRYPIRRAQIARLPVENVGILAEAQSGNYLIRQFENGTIKVFRDALEEPIAKPILRHLSAELGISLLNRNGNKKNTRQLGAEVIAGLNA